MWSVEGVVVGGQRLGRELGFPTANIELNEPLDIPNGVYISQVEIDGVDLPYRAISNLGENPTVGGCRRRLETHILDFEGELYNHRLRVRLLKFLRREQHFSDIDALRQQIVRDVKQAREFEL